MSTVRLVRGFNCPTCGAGVELRAGAHARSVACATCGSVLDATDPNLAVLQRFAEREHVQPAIPLGTRGTLDGAPWEAVGFQVRTITVEGDDYSWREYLLFNPWRGWRYLTEYDGHWNVVTSVRTVPAVAQGLRPTARLAGTEFRHFQTATARTTYVLGEFPWQARAGDEVVSEDFVAPPRLLSREDAGGEVTWSLGTYAPPAEIWRAFALPGDPPPARGVFANQPNPHRAGARTAGRLLALFLVLLATMGIARCATARDAEVLAQRYVYDPAAGDTGAFVTAPFELRDRTSNVALDLWANLDNSFLFLEVALVNDATGDVRDVGRELSYYHGVEDGESWREGSENDRVVLPRVPPGRYYLRVRPEGGQAAAAFGPPPRTEYTVRVRHDVARPGYWLLALAALLLPPIVPLVRSASFEHARWAESDHAATASGDGEEEEEE